jgi:hypothetical protein
MPRGLYKSCQFDGVYHHPDELIRVPVDAPESAQIRLCLEHAEQFLKHLIRREECKFARRFKRTAA